MLIEKIIKKYKILYAVILPFNRAYDFLVDSSSGNLFCILFNIKSILRGWTIKIYFDSRSGLYEAREGFKKVFFKHTKIANGSYTRGFAYRAQAIGDAYLLDQIKFSNGDLIVDCGANVGDLHLYFENHNLSVQLLAFEPSANEFICLSRNVSGVGVQTYNLGLWNSNSNLKFYVSSDGADSSLIEPLNYDEVVEINTRRLDSYTFNSPIKLLKIEAEGCEPEVLEGCSEILNSVYYISADLGFERGVDKASTLVPVCNYLCSRGFVIQDINFDRLCVLFRNDRMQLI
jgi:FkbM family methyltransferase